MGEGELAEPPLRTLRRRIGRGAAAAEVVAVTGGPRPHAGDVPGAAVAAERVSPDAVAMLRWLDTDPDELPRGASTLLELGCGVGLLGLSCAALRPDASLVLTDVAALLPSASRSVEANEESLAARVAVRPLAFGDAAALAAALVDLGSRPAVAVGAGIFYWECVYAPLAETLRQLCCDFGGQAILGYFRRDWKVERRLWTKLLPQQGLEVEVLWEGEVEEPEDAASFAPACTRTLGEWNARVYRVSAAAPGLLPKPAVEEGEGEDLHPWLAYGDNQGRTEKNGGRQKAGKGKRK